MAVHRPQRRASHRVNNSITVFCVGSLHLDFFIDACVRIGRQREVIGRLDVGTNFLSGLRQILPFPLLGNVGMVSPLHITEIAAGQPARVTGYMQALPEPLASVDLCGSLQGQVIQAVVADEAMFDAVVDRLLDSGGEVLNGLRG